MSMRRSAYRKRGRSVARRRAPSRRRPTRRAITASRGFSRTSGMYGRFQGGGPRTERKCIDFLYTLNNAAGFNSTGFFASMLTDGTDGIDQGSKIIDRQGNRVVVKSIELDGSFWQPTAATSTSQAYMFAVVLDRQPNGALPTKDDVLGVVSPSSGVFGSALIPAQDADFNNLTNSRRFVTLWKQRVVAELIPSGNGTTYTARTKKIHKIIKCSIPVEYATGPAGPGSVGDGLIDKIKTNNIFLMAFASTANLHASVGVRVRFVDP